jgi:hypothetical protein
MAKTAARALAAEVILLVLEVTGDDFVEFDARDFAGDLGALGDQVITVKAAAGGAGTTA